MIILGHRGEGVTNRDAAVYGVRLPQRTNPFYNNDIFPENSLSAFESALKHGADGIECDVFASKDNVPMIIHDDQLARNVDGYHFWGKENKEDILGNVSDFTCVELQEKFTIGNNERIPTLKELIELFIRYNPDYKARTGRNYTINIELKGGKRVAIATYNVLKQYIDNPDIPFKAIDFLFNSFEAECVDEMKKLDARMRCALGITTKELYKRVKMPGWVPLESDYAKTTIPDLIKSIVNYNLSGLDVVTSDVLPSLAQLCAENALFLNAATNALRLRIGAEDRDLPEAKWTELEREEKEVRKMAIFSEQYDILVYYKADNPGHMQNYLLELTQANQLAWMERPITIRQYDPTLLRSLRVHMRKFEAKTENVLGKELARMYAEIIEESLESEDSFSLPETTEQGSDDESDLSSVSYCSQPSMPISSSSGLLPYSGLSLFSKISIDSNQDPKITPPSKTRKPGQPE